MVLPYNPTADPIGPFGATTAAVRGFADNVPVNLNLFLVLSATQGGPFNLAASAPVAGTNTPGQLITASFLNLQPSTQYWFRLEVRDTLGARVQVSEEATFTTLAGSSGGVVGGLIAAPCCGPGGGEGADVEQTLLCDILPNGDIAGTALAVYEYDASGNPAGPPTFVDPATGVAYVAQGILQPCPGDVGCGAPTQFCFQSSAPVDQPGRMYDVTFPLAQGFNVQSIVKDLVDTPVNITWEVTDPDASQFVTDLQTAIQSQFAGQTVTVTPGVVDSCTGLANFTVHIECLRLDQNPTTLLQLKYNGGRDAIINPAFTTTPPVPDNGGVAFLGRQDAPATGPAAGGPLVDCTNVANTGWQTNDIYGSFEAWGLPGNVFNTAAGTTPTPRGTAIQEINSWGSGPVVGPFGDNPNTIWQTFTIPAGGNFKVRVVVGGRAGTENIGIKLSTGDVNDTGIGDVINTSVNAGRVTTQDAAGNSNGTGGPAGPWTTFDQTVPLAAGTYTLAFTGPDQPNGNPGQGNAFGGLFTDMRVYQDAPNTLANFVNDDDTCVVPTNETSTTCEFWAPRCSGGQIVGWYNVTDGEELTNAQFWAQVPAPTCCSGSSGDGGGGSSTGNLVHTYLVCGTLNGETRTMSRVVVSDQSGGIIADSFIDTDGAPVTPDTWQPGDCSGDSPIVGEFILCDSAGPFVRKLFQNAQGIVSSVVNVTLEGAPYVPVGTVQACDPADREPACWTTTAGGATVFTGTIRHDDSLPAPGWLLFDQNVNLVPSTEPGLTFVPCAESMDPITTTGLCLGNGTPIGIVVRRNSVTGVLIQDGWINLLTGAFTAGNPPPGTIACGDTATFSTSGILCDVDGGGNVVGLVIVQYSFNPDGSVAGTTLLNAVTGAVYVPTGTITTCPTGTELPDQDLVILCDNNGAFLRDYRRDETGAVVAVSDYTLAGVAYATVGTVGSCAGRDQELQILCDSTAPNPVRFLRRYNYNLSTGVLVSVVDTTLDGTTPFVPTGAVGVCATTVQADTDFVEEVLCDANGTAFIRLFRFNSATGVLISTTNTTLAGAAFVPVGVVGTCSNCCPQVIGEGCTNTGSGFYTAIRATNGTISLIDSVSGAAILAANIVACPGDNTVRTLTSEARLVGDADAPWTPGADVVGTLTSVTLTVLSGTATLTDSSGTVLAGLPAGLSLTWEAEDDNVLTGPQSIDAIGGQTVVNWTRR